MLLNKEVEIKLNPSNIKYYEGLGYKIPRVKDNHYRWVVAKGTTIKVKIKDLSKGSDTLVDVKCDCEDCKSLYLKPIQYSSYNKNLHENNKYYCKKCSNKLFGKNKTLKTKLLKSISFAHWLIKNLHLKQAINIIARWDTENNGCLPTEVSYSSMGFNNKGYWFKCLEHSEHESELKNINDFTKGQDGSINCIACGSIAEYLIDTYGKNALNDYWDYEKNVDNNGNPINPWKILKCSDIKVWIKCQNEDKPYHESYLIYCSNICAGRGCPYCSNRKIHPLDSLGQYIINNFGEVFLNNIWSKKNKKSAFEYAPMGGEKVWWKCLEVKHKDYHRKVSESHDVNFRCPECVRERKESFLQEKVRLYLESLGYIILHENKCTIVPKNPKTKLALPFDNEIKELKLILEINGIQHYEVISWHKHKAKHNDTTPEYELHYQQLKDRYKKFIAYKQGYNYIAIPYWADDENEEWKQLIINKIKIIKNIK